MKLYYPASECDSVWRVSSRSVEDVYPVRGQASDYEVLVTWKADQSKSRLHPTILLQQARFEIDKHISAARILEDLAEAREICAAGCTVFTEDPIPANSYGLDLCSTT